MPRGREGHRNPYFMQLRNFVADDAETRGEVADLSSEQVLAWADAHYARAGKWPTYNSGEIPDSDGEDWLGIEAALMLGLRGFPGQDSLCRFLQRHRGKRNVQALPPLRIKQILRWADAWHKRTGLWPHRSLDPIPDCPDENWNKVDLALRWGLRGLPGGSSLAQLLAERRGVRNHLALPGLTEAQILAWADRHYRRTGAWPRRDDGPIAGTSENWSAVNAALENGVRGLRGGSSLPQLLAVHRGRRNRAGLPALTEAQLLVWADAFHARTGRWPGPRSGDIPEAPGEKWSAVAQALSHGARGWPGGYSLARLLADRRGVRNRNNPPPLNVAQILAWADAHHRRTGRWPDVRSGAVPEAPEETWTAVDLALRRGGRGLPGGSSLPLLLEAQRGKRHLHRQRRLTEALILRWARSHRKRTGQWPRAMSGPVADAPGEKWMNLNMALRLGLRGLPGGASLHFLLGQSNLGSSHRQTSRRKR